MGDLIEKGLREAFNVEQGEHGLALKFMGAYFFSEGSYKLHSEGRRRFIKLVKGLRNTSSHIVVEGHTDTSARQGGFTSGAIAALRAGSAAEILINKVGVNRMRVTTLSYADKRPLAANGTALGRERNRRIEIKIPYR